MEQSVEGTEPAQENDTATPEAPKQSESLQDQSVSSVGAQAGDAPGDLDTAQSLPGLDSPADPTRPSDEAILSYENQIRYS
jgi:hypothetical protein